MFGLSGAALLLSVSAAFVAAFVRGLAGFGMAILLVPLLGLMILPAEAVVVSNLLGLLIGFAGIRGVWTAADKRAVAIISVLAVLAAPVGLALLHATDPALARLLIALVAVAAFVLVLLPPRPDGHVPHLAETGATGLAAGVLTGFAGMPGPPVVPYFLRQSTPAARARASMLAVFFATSAASTAAGLGMGTMLPRHAGLAVALFGPIWLGNRLGGIAFGRIPERVWRWIVAALLAASAIAALVRLLP